MTAIYGPSFLSAVFPDGPPAWVQTAQRIEELRDLDASISRMGERRKAIAEQMEAA